MATYLELQNLVVDSDFQKRVTRALHIASQNIRDEDPGTANHGERLLWADKVRSERLSTSIEAIVQLVVNNATIQTNGALSTDADIQFVINGLIDTDLYPMG